MIISNSCAKSFAQSEVIMSDGQREWWTLDCISDLHSIFVGLDEGSYWYKNWDDETIHQKVNQAIELFDKLSSREDTYSIYNRDNLTSIKSLLVLSKNSKEFKEIASRMELYFRLASTREYMLITDCKYYDHYYMKKISINARNILFQPRQGIITHDEHERRKRLSENLGPNNVFFEYNGIYYGEGTIVKFAGRDGIHEMKFEKGGPTGQQLRSDDYNLVFLRENNLNKIVGIVSGTNEAIPQKGATLFGISVEPRYSEHPNSIDTGTGSILFFVLGLISFIFKGVIYLYPIIAFAFIIWALRKPRGKGEDAPVGPFVSVAVLTIIWFMLLAQSCS